MNVSIVPVSKVNYDPRQLLYHYPSISPIRLSKLLGEFYHWKMVEVAEEMARMQGYVLVPSCCMHYRRKQNIPERQKIKVGKHMFYMLKPEDMTENEQEKLKKYVEKHQKKRARSQRQYEAV